MKRIHWVGHNEALGQRIRNIKQAGLIPSLVVFERTEDKTRELVWIIKHSTLGTLLNVVGRPKPPKQKTIEQKRREHEDSIVKLVIERLKKK